MKPAAFAFDESLSDSLSEFLSRPPAGVSGTSRCRRAFAMLAVAVGSAALGAALVGVALALPGRPSRPETLESFPDEYEQWPL